MARASRELIRALRVTAERLRGQTAYQWGHMGACNCGHLAQTITKLDQRDIHRAAMIREGDWQGQANEYCPQSGFHIDDIITALLDAGLAIRDIAELERLSDPAVLASLPGGKRYLRHNQRDHVVLYLDAWADLLEARLPAAQSAAA